MPVTDEDGWNNMDGWCQELHSHNTVSDMVPNKSKHSLSQLSYSFRKMLTPIRFKPMTSGTCDPMLYQLSYSADRE